MSPPAARPPLRLDFRSASCSKVFTSAISDPRDGTWPAILSSPWWWEKHHMWFPVEAGLERVNKVEAEEGDEGTGWSEWRRWCSSQRCVSPCASGSRRMETCGAGAGRCCYWHPSARALHFRCFLLTTASQVCLGWRSRRVVRTACQLVTCWEGQPRFVH